MNTKEIITNHLDQQELKDVQFSKSDVLHSVHDRSERQKKLNMALTIGKSYSSPVNIKFRNDTYKLVETGAVIWGITDSFVILQSATLIPIKSIVDIEIN